MGAGGQYGCALFGGQNTAQRQATGDAFGEGDHIGLDVKLLVGKQGAGPADTGLDLVHQQQPVLLLAELGQSLDHSLVQRAHAALALDQLHHDGAHVIAPLSLDALQGGVGVAEVLHEGEEVGVVVGLTGGGDGGHGPAVEGVVQGDDGAAALAVFVKAVLPGQLDHGFVGLCAGVAKEHLVHARAGAEFFRQLGAGLGVVEVGDVTQILNLLGDGADPSRVAVAQGIDPDAAGEVDVLFPGQAVQGRALAMVDVHGEAGVGVHYVGVVHCFQFFKSHGSHSFM